MSKHRSITGFGPAAITLERTSASNATNWLPLGIFRGNQLEVAAVFSATSAGTKAKFQATLSTAVAGLVVNLSSWTSTQTGTLNQSTSTGLFGWVRLASTDMSTGVGDTIKAYYGAVV
jgi:hypothetical protein